MTPKKSPKNPSNNSQTFLDHLLELRTRFFHFILIFLVLSLVAYSRHNLLLRFISQPLGQTLFYSSPAGAFDLVIKVSLFFGFIASVPFLIYEVLSFIAPVFPSYNARKWLIVIVVSFLLMLIGIIFAFYVTLPAALYFLNQFGSNSVQSLITADAYFSFVLRYLLGFGLYFQLPLIIFLIDHFYPLSIFGLLKAERWVILFSTIFAAVITPTPDIINLAIMAVPCILLYQIALISLWIAHKQAKKH